ncbi:cell division protein FtsZ [Nonlabens tegetincola]|uniref:cell division protein FtsZ n=1 Tax=Nonlabens tegetincola TaxID=323273 RepID=UPI000CF41C5A|nr:cell division protein FtsZ [Nonlabens tegetincola]PQJ19198.1 cell division protein FtsZ [Nonlabens tegetincola]
MSMEVGSDLSFDLPKNKSNVIKVIGVGGGGSNAIKHMFQQGIKGVDFVICNTDAQALENSPIPNKIQLGVSLTEGLGAGANPEIGERAAQESISEIQRLLDTNTKMVFITAGMGGGTGTGAAPVIAQVAKEMDILTVGIVTTPFQFEGRIRNEQAQKGIDKLRKSVDSLIIINNNKLRDVYGNLGFKAGFSKADEVLATASRGIAEVITKHYIQNIDLRDAKTVLVNSGTAIMGSAHATGSNRAQEGIIKALDSPLLNDNKITGAKHVLLLIVSGSEEITLDEISEINEHIQSEAGGSANIIMGVGEDEELGDSIAVTVIATGFNAEQQNEISNTEAKRIIHTLEEEQRASRVLDEATDKVVPGKLILDLEEDHEDEIQAVDNNAFAKAEPKKTVQPSQPQEPLIIKHELGDEDPEDAIPVMPKLFEDEPNPMIPTTEVLKNIEVVYEEVLDVKPQSQLDFVIEETPVVQQPEVESIEEERDQFFLDFDLPLSQQLGMDEENTEEINALEVNDPVHVIPVTEVNETGVTKYSLDDYMEKEDELVNAQPVKKVEETNTVIEPELEIVAKTVQAPAEDVESSMEIDEEIDPTELPINEMLLRNAEKRKRTMHHLNFKFKSSHRLEELEKQPAFKRQGVELEAPKTDDGRSRTTLNIDENDELQFRSSNNSFLHDAPD